jgi:glycosyltransferase involved in cell wall biosynthesis
MNDSLYAVYFRPPDFMQRSGLAPLAEAVGAHPLTHGCFWRDWGRWHWRLEEGLRRWGQHYYGSRWNYLAPWLDEWRLASHLPRASSLVHFLFAEFAGPRRAGPFRRRGARIVGTFHTSPRRLEQVIGSVHLEVYDAISVVAEGQRAYFLERGFPAERLFLTLHGVDTDYFHPDARRGATPDNEPLKGLLVGATERDHAFAAKLMAALPAGLLHLSVATKPSEHPVYRSLRNVTLLPHLNDEAMLKAYQEADLLVMPLMDATANNAILEAMACGTPVMTNRTSGTNNYVDPSCNVVMEEKVVEGWMDVLMKIAADRSGLLERRRRVRAWAETLSWAAVAPQYRAMYAYVRKGMSV